MPFSESVRIEALVSCQRHCCLCHERVHTRISCHHIIQEADGGENTLDNCIPLCPGCHAEVKAFDPRHHPGMTSYRPAELLRRRDDWYQTIARRMRDLETNLNRSRVNIPSSPELSGEIDFDYSDYNGFHLIGTGLSEFMTRWSGASRDSIHSYTDKTNISIALAPPAFSLKDLSKVDSFNFSSRVRSPRLREFLVLENHHGRYGVIQILGLQSRSHGDNFDRVRLRYWLLEDGTADFTKFA